MPIAASYADGMPVTVLKQCYKFASWTHAPTILAFFALCYISEPAVAAEPAASNVEADELHHRIGYWSFDEMPKGEVVGKVAISDFGPRPPLFPTFASGNRALALRSPSYIKLSELDDKKYLFANGDTITVEAWVNATSLAENAYIVGKGRTGSGGVRGRDQNWAVRLRKRGGQACLNFLFHSLSNDASAGEFHRWTTKDGFSVDSGWHHIAVTYKFGAPKSIVGFVDGKKRVGTWDLGGETAKPPMVTDSPVWIGSAMNGNKGNSFDGQIDDLAVYRSKVPGRVLRDRYQFVPPAVVRPEVPARKIAVQLFGPFKGLSKKPAHIALPKKTWHQETLAFTRLPFSYDTWGVRDDWTSAEKKSMLVRSWTNLELEPGDYRLMIRSRGYSELFIDGKQILSTPVQPNRAGAHHVVDPLPVVPVVGMRPHAMSEHERMVEFHSDGGNHDVRFDAIIGGPSFRLEFGETCVAIARDGDVFSLISHQEEYPLTDEGWGRFVRDQLSDLGQRDLQTRRSNAAQQNPYWDKRHAYAKETLRSNAIGDASIDVLIDARIKQENQRRSGVTVSQTHSFYSEKVQPILRTHCARCHSEKRQGELSVFDRDNLLKGGESGEVAITAGDPDASYLLQLVSASEDDYRMPPKGDGLAEDEIATLRKWISGGAVMPVEKKSAIELTSLADETTFLRRVFIDCVGVPPTLQEAKAFLDDDGADKRERLIDRLLDDPRWADNWVGYWQDVLAENPNLLKPTLNNTGPFRFWIHEAIVDNKPIDRFATELIQMRGSKWYGGAGGFSIASQNDVPMAAKSHVIGTAFMGVEMKCARCHDAPYHSWKQSDLFNLAAMLERKSIKLPETSTVPAAFFDKQSRDSLIKVTLEPGATIHGEWPFAEFAPDVAAEILPPGADSRELLAAQVTASRRFAEVIANRVWQRLMGAALVQPVDDWEGNPPSDPRLLELLADNLIDNDYDLKQLAKTILLSNAYGRVAAKSVDDERFFAGPYRRRMTAEQIVDSAFHVAGQTMQTEQLTMDVEGTLPADKFLNFGFPQCAWEFTSLANERDRPSLALPRIQAIADVLKAFGWRNSRPEPTSAREETPNLVQPGSLANGTLGIWLTRLSDESGLTQMMVADQSVIALVDDLFLRFLTRLPTDAERERFVVLLSDGFDQRVRSLSMSEIAPPPERFRYVSWSNHLNTDANLIKVQMAERARMGPPPTRRLGDAWRQRAEDAVWALLNSPEMIVIP